MVSDIETLKIWDQDPVIKSAFGGDSGYEWEAELPNEKPWQEYLIAELGQKPIGFIQVIDPLLEETHYWGQVDPNLRAIDIWIGEPFFRGKGYGSKIMQLIFDRCFQIENRDAILVDPLKSNLRAINFYQNHGFEIIRERVFDSEVCLEMRKAKP